MQVLLDWAQSQSQVQKQTVFQTTLLYLYITPLHLTNFISSIPQKRTCILYFKFEVFYTSIQLFRELCCILMLQLLFLFLFIRQNQGQGQGQNLLLIVKTKAVSNFWIYFVKCFILFHFSEWDDVFSQLIIEFDDIYFQGERGFFYQLIIKFDAVYFFGGGFFFSFEIGQLLNSKLKKKGNKAVLPPQEQTSQNSIIYFQGELFISKLFFWKQQLI
eukprot:TRINITY_DN9025_c1_g1_i14.p1 TRINITY_DN9025_c1_g1~~TRINITY_DN9025_c1_g1_i14.p1  ORF type:complete len:216 (+),score=11.58 TRINITY_DN9025_c1_g1_i14:259-906(+)